MTRSVASCFVIITIFISSTRSRSMEDVRKPILPNPPEWKPTPNPSSIEIPGLDASANVNDQIEQIEQLITMKLQVNDSVIQTY